MSLFCNNSLFGEKQFWQECSSVASNTQNVLIHRNCVHNVGVVGEGDWQLLSVIR